MADRNGYIGRAPGDSSVTVARQTFSPTGITTDFTFESGYTPGYFDIFINGAKMIEGSDYTSTDGSTFVILNGGAISGDVIEGVAYKAFNAATATIGISSAGTPISTQANTLNFVGTGNTFALRGSTIDVSISVGAGGTWSNYDSNAGVTTTKKVKIQNNLEVTGVSTFSGFVAFSTSISVGGTVTYEDVTNIDSIGIITARSGVSIGDSIFHTGDTNTAIRFPAADTFTVETAGSERVRVTGIGSIGINETTPDSKVDIVHSTSANTATENLIHLRTDPSGSYASRGLFVKIGRDGGYDNSGAHYDIVGSAGNSGFHVFEVQGSEKLRIDSSGRLLLGTTTEGEANADDLTIATSGHTGMTIRSGTANRGNIYFSDGTSGDAEYRGYVTYDHDGDKLTLGTANANRLLIDSSGRLLVGTSSSRSNWFNTTGADPLLQVESSSNPRIAITRNDATDNGPDLLLGKSRSTSYAAVANNDSLGRISFQGADGSQMVAGAYIQSFVDGTPGANDMPGRIVFSTTADGAAAPAERLRITNTIASVSSTGDGANGIGCVGINEADPATDALSLAVHAPYGIEDPRPLVYMRRSHGIGGGSATDETVLHLDGTASYNSAGVVYGIKVNTKHNLNGSHYSGHFVNDGSQYSANDTSAVYVETHKKDTNGAGALMALHANGRITTGSGNNGYAIAGFFQTGNNVNGRPIVCLQEYTTDTYTHQIEFRKNNGSSIVSVGSIKSNNTATQYNTSSDYRLKENVVTLTGAIDRLKQLQPKRFNFIGAEEIIDGFIAHEVSSTAPYAVSGEKDAMKTELVMSEDGKEQFDENGEAITREVIDPQGVDYSKLSTLTIAALQEALAKIETLETQNASLEARLTTLEG
jgi:hypothetical protein